MQRSAKQPFALDYASAAPRHRAAGVLSRGITATILIVSAVLAILFFSLRAFQKSVSLPTPRKTLAHLSAKEATREFAGFQARWSLPTNLGADSGDAEATIYFDTTEVWYRFGVADDSFHELLTALSAMPKGRNGESWTVETDATKISFRIVGSPPPPWWPSAAKHDAEQLKITAYSQPEHVRACEWWLIYDRAARSLFVHEQ